MTDELGVDLENGITQSHFWAPDAVKSLHCKNWTIQFLKMVLYTV